MQLGITTFAETTPDPATGATISSDQRLREVLEEAELAEQVGLDVYAVGEHHRPDFAVSAPAVVLAAIATRTRRIRLASAVTVLSSDDPVRVFQDFATLDLLSGGRAEIIAGRGSFTESFPLFGQDMDDYDELFAEKLDLLLRLRESPRVFWHGKHRPALTGQGVYPRPLQQPLPVWIAVGGSPNSMIRAGTLGLPVALAIIGGLPVRFVPLVELYRKAAARAGHENLPLAINSHGFVGDDASKVADEFFGPYAQAMTKIGADSSGLWDEQDQFFYDVLNIHGRAIPLRVRSMVGLIPLFAVEVLDSTIFEELPDFTKRLQWFFKHRPDLAKLVSRWQDTAVQERHLLSLLRGHRMKRTFRCVASVHERVRGARV